MPYKAIGRRRFPSMRELQQMPAGDRGPRLRALLAQHHAGLDDPNPRIVARHRSCIEQVMSVGRMVGVDLQ